MSVKTLDPFTCTPDSTRWGGSFVAFWNLTIALVCILGVGSGDVGGIEFCFGLTDTSV